jgi:signal transduction histidine kinase
VGGEAARLFDRGHTGAEPGSGIGPFLARDLAASLGGGVSLTGRRPATFTLRTRTSGGTGPAGGY